MTQSGIPWENATTAEKGLRAWLAVKFGEAWCIFDNTAPGADIVCAVPSRSPAWWRRGREGPGDCEREDGASLGQ